MIYYLLGCFILLLMLTRWERRSPGGGHRPRYKPGLNRIKPPGHADDSPHITYILGKPRWGWDIRPRWLWEERWKVEELPYGVKWADKLRAEINQKYGKHDG